MEFHAAYKSSRSPLLRWMTELAVAGQSRYSTSTNSFG